MRVKKVEYIDGYKLKILFSDNKVKVVDLEPIIIKGKRMFLPLKDVEYFKQVSLDDKEYPLSICWPNEAAICPDVLYEMGREIRETKSRASLSRTKQIKRQASFAMSVRWRAKK
jgi:hypothetical protein